MLPAILVTIATFLMEFYTASPVYNMQPAFITANIGTGRNIRNLPCISRKNNQSGVCMFAIDCLKANGTHLGTCIDRFYFGSCCRIEPVHDIIENSIDTDIIPAREPPLRLSSTIKPITTTKLTTTTIKTTTTEKLATTIRPETTVAYKLSTFQSVDGSTTENPTTVTTKTTTTAKLTTTTSKPKTSKPSTIKPKPVTTSKPVTKPKPITTTTTRVTTTKPTRTTTKRPVITKKPPTTTKSPTTTSTTTTTTAKPALTTTKFATTTTKKPTTTTTRPTSTTTRSTTTSRKPVSTTSSTTTTTVAPTIESNEIEKLTTTTTEPQIITWSIIESDRNTTTVPLTSSTNSTSEEWQPITTPDGWVLLPSLPPNTTTTPIETTTTESTSKPSITFIPIGSTSSTLTNGTTAPPSTTTTLTTSSAIINTTSPVSTTSPMPAVEGTSEDRPVNMSDFTDVCGRRMYPEARIVGGEKSTFGKWPWQISLRQWRTSTYLHKCGAALLNENWAITAAHCVDNVPPSDLLLRLGEHDLSTESEPYLHQERRVQIVASHPQFDPRTFEYDLALLRFYEPVTFQPNILPVCVPQTDENFVGRTAYVTGWGRLYEDGPLPSVLQEVSVPVINNTVCESMYRSAGYIEHIPHIFICAGWRRGGYDSCEGDSGGPMVIQREDKRYLLAGVISWGIGCAEPNQPGVYTRISEFREWINQILQF